MLRQMRQHHVPTGVGEVRTLPREFGRAKLDHVLLAHVEVNVKVTVKIMHAITFTISAAELLV